jgi:fructose-1,6-bisphosphatase/inositol monophosphatase family enzyme
MNDVLIQMKHAALEAAANANAIRDAQQLHSELKADRSVVTAADKAAEAIIRNRLGALVPGAQFLGEESEPEKGWDIWLRTPAKDKGRWWVVDPIDGTGNFDRNDGPWAVSIALQDSDVTQLAVVYVASAENGHNGILYWAQRGKGTFSQMVTVGELVGTPTRRNYKDHSPEDAPIMALFVGHFSEDMPEGTYTGQMIAGTVHESLAATASTYAPGQPQYPARCACANALSVMEGKSAAYCHGVHYPWDGAAIYAILNEAGYPVVEYASPTQPGISSLLAASSDALFAAFHAAYRTASPKSALTANAAEAQETKALRDR